MPENNPHALVLYNHQGLPFDLFLKELETTIPAARQIVLAGLWIVIQKVGQKYGVSSHSSEGIRMLSEFVGRLLNVGLVLQYGNDFLAPHRACWAFEKELKRVILRSKPGEYRFADFFQEVSAMFFAQLVKLAREYGEDLQKNIAFFAGPRNRLRWETHPARPEDIVYVSDLDMDQYRWYVQYLTPGPVVNKDWYEREKMTKELINFELLRINSLVGSRKEILFYRRVAVFFIELSIRLDTIPPMVYPIVISVLHQWLNTQILLAVNPGVPAMQEHVLFEEYPPLMRRLKVLPDKEVWNFFCKRMRRRNPQVVFPAGVCGLVLQRVGRMRLWSDTVSIEIVNEVFIPLSEAQTRKFHRELFGKDYRSLPDNFEARKILGDT